MTHDELLAKIDSNLSDCGYDCESCKIDNASWVALRAVVELINNLQDTESWQDDVDYKNGYNNAMNDIRLTIEKELR
ncbi:hypothetical protein UFOVP204_116 [uncultured Caudovirales phage]|uniref:Uncharacterized protein n=1 Tax=uncultured Caudovirales phage TaxID=2100421 RepID=A0A6J7WQ38_9CAUD|nr:hypothetical protein UFOVP204_116 [uncultured Caudovirales phage]